MKLMKGEHTLGQQKYYMDCRRTNYAARALFIEDLETFEMIGLGPATAYDVIVYLHTDINLLNVSVSYFGSLVFLCISCPAYIFLPGNYAGDHDHLSASTSADQSSVNVDTETYPWYITTVNEVFFDGVLFEQQTDRLMNFNIIVTNSIFANGSTCTFWSSAPNLKSASSMDSYTRYLEITNSTYIDTGLWINYVNANVKLHNNIIDSRGVIINTIHSNVIISGEQVFDLCYRAQCDDTVTVLSSNVTISGNITFANNIRTTISAFSSSITLVGSITFKNNTGIKGGAMSLFSSTLNIARDTSVYFYNNTAEEVGGAIYVTNEDSDYYSIESALNYLYIPCFYQLLDFDEQQKCNMRFVNNSAIKGGDNIYGDDYA